jgi:homoserine dehydrogenase
VSARPREVRIGLLGYGCVGSAVDRLVREQRDEIERATGLRFSVVRALVRDPRKLRDFQPPDGVLTSDFADIRDDPSIDVAAEVMGGLIPTERNVRELLAAGKPVASANKQLLSRRGAQLARASARAGLPLRFEAAVCGAVPVVRTLCEALPPGTVRRITGIVNGTTNYVLGSMDEGCTFDEALASAKELGYAETDATEDLSGEDAAAKMALLASVAFRRRVELEEVVWNGIEGISTDDLAAARADGRRIRLVGEAVTVDGSVAVRVVPTALLAEDSLAQVPLAFNEIALEGDGVGRLVLRGPGAGGLETATSVVGDLIALASGGAASHVARLAARRSPPIPTQSKLEVCVP